MAQLTIVMPAYNAAAFIHDAVGSLLNQTFRDFQLWIADDGSTDNTADKIKAFQDSRIKLFSFPENAGRVRTVNKLVNEITTPFFTITDADDISHPKKLEKQMERMMNDPTLMMCGTSFWAMDEKGYLVREMKLLTDVDQLRAEALKQSQFLGPTTMMRKAVIDEFPDFYRTYFIDNFADADLACRILDKYPATNLREPLYFYRIVKTSVTRKKVTVRNLNLHRLVGYLSQQRRHQGHDCLQRNDLKQADRFMEEIKEEYDRDLSFYPRHQAFFHLYWGLVDLAFINILNAIRARPFYSKNYLSFFYIIYRITFFYLNRGVNKKHYRSLMR